MTYTDTQLKQALAKMLPPELALDGANLLFWKDSDMGSSYSREVLDTELLHLCRMVECNTPHEKTNEYIMILSEKTGSIFHMDVIRATWQQRTTALAKTLNIEIV